MFHYYWTSNIVGFLDNVSWLSNTFIEYSCCGQWSMAGRNYHIHTNVLWWLETSSVLVRRDWYSNNCFSSFTATCSSVLAKWNSRNGNWAYFMWAVQATFDTILSSLCLFICLSVMLCIVAKWYILQQKCLRKWIGSAHSNTILQLSKF